MLPILTPAESAALDRASAERGVPTGELMENAGWAVARAARRMLDGSYGRRVALVCGKGNNGGDGLVAARVLDRWGLGVTAFLLPDPREYRGAAAESFRRFASAGGRWRPFLPRGMNRDLERADLVVDAVFGTGFHGVPQGGAEVAIVAMNSGRIPVLAVDIPSGVEGETGAVRGEAVRAAATVTFGTLKPGLVFFPGAGLGGAVEVADIGFPPGLVGCDLWLVEEGDVAALLPSREPETHKRQAGMVVVVAGSRAMTGAAVMTAASCYRAGAGLVTLAVPEGILPVVEGALTEATFLPLPETEHGTVAEDAWPLVAERLQQAGAAAIGPGLTTEPSTAAFVRRFVRESPVPFVLDADGLNAFAGDGGRLAERRSDAVITPHAGEFSRLTGVPVGEVEADRVGRTRAAAEAFRCAVLLKGSRTVVAEPDGRARVNPTGGPFLATGGTGDVLTGAIAALLAAGLPAGDAAVAAAYVHGMAGRLAAAERAAGTTATDVLDRLPTVLAALAPLEV